MKLEDIIKTAKEAGMADAMINAPLSGLLLVRFAALVAAAEREECAKICDSLGVHPELNVYQGGPEWYKHGKRCAEAIRSRGKQ